MAGSQSNYFACSLKLGSTPARITEILQVTPDYSLMNAFSGWSMKLRMKWEQGHVYLRNNGRHKNLSRTNFCVASRVFMGAFNHWMVHVLILWFRICTASHHHSPILIICPNKNFLLDQLAFIKRILNGELYGVSVELTTYHTIFLNFHLTELIHAQEYAHVHCWSFEQPWIAVTGGKQDGRWEMRTKWSQGHKG